MFEFLKCKRNQGVICKLNAKPRVHTVCTLEYMYCTTVYMYTRLLGYEEYGTDQLGSIHQIFFFLFGLCFNF